MVALGFVILVLATPVPIIMFKDIFDTLKEIREKIVGAHFIDVARIGIVFKTFSIGVENLRKNAFRTFLTLLSIILVTLSLTAFTSVSPIWVMVKSPPPMQTAMHWEPRYEGILIARTEINAPINPNLANLLKTLYGEKVDYYYLPVYEGLLDHKHTFNRIMCRNAARAGRQPFLPTHFGNQLN